MEAHINNLPEDINYMFYIKPKGAKRFSTYNPGQGTMGTGRVFTELYRKEHLQKFANGWPKIPAANGFISSEAETAKVAIAENATTTPTIKKNLQVGGGATIPKPQRLEKFGNTLLHIVHVGKMVGQANRLRTIAYVSRKCSTTNSPPIGSTR